MPDSHEHIRNGVRSIEKAQREAFQAWNEENYHPAMRELRKRCERIGHVYRRTEFNFMKTRQWKECAVCGGGYDYEDLD